MERLTMRMTIALVLASLLLQWPPPARAAEPVDVRVTVTLDEAQLRRVETSVAGAVEARVLPRLAQLETRVSAMERAQPSEPVPTEPPQPAPTEPPPPPGAPPEAPEASGAIDPGWTTFTPHADTRMIFVSAEGDDFNDGLSPATPVRTPEKGCSLLRNDWPDWLLFRRGDTFDLDPAREGAFREWAKSGDSPRQRIVVTAYGDPSRPRPILNSNGLGVLSANSGQSVHHVTFADLHFYANRRDPASPQFDGGGTYEYGLQWSQSGSRDIVFEGVLIEYFANNVSLGAPPKRNDGPEDVTFRRCVVRRAYSHLKKGHAQGAGFGNTTRLTIDGCFFDHNGWEPRVPESKRTGFNHGTYFYHTKDTRIADSLFARNAYGGVKVRGDKEGDVRNFVVEDCVFADELVGVYVSGDKNSGDPDATVAHDVIVRGNLFTRIGGELDGTKHGFGASFSQVRNGTMVNNLFVHKTMNTNWPAMELDKGKPFADLLVKDNVVHEWPRGYSKDEVWIRYLDDGMKLEGNRAFQEPGTFADPTRTLDGYVKSIGFDTTDAFYDAAGAQRRGHWRDELTAARVLAYIRPGYAPR